MIILDNNGEKIEFKIEGTIGQTQDRRNYTVSMPTVICSSRTDAEKIQKALNTFVYNLPHEVLGIDKKVTIEEVEKSIDPPKE